MSKPLPLATQQGAERLHQQELRATRWDQDLLFGDQTRLVREQRPALRPRPALNPVSTTTDRSRYIPRYTILHTFPPTPAVT